MQQLDNHAYPFFYQFFFYYYGHPRHLHSFPTRRSSDLEAAAFMEQYLRAHATDPGGVVRSTRAVLRRARSEEHTSELQSRGHLVCRLLLEKKKKRAPCQ